jgi:hypothetical protein
VVMMEGWVWEMFIVPVSSLFLSLDGVSGSALRVRSDMPS